MLISKQPEAPAHLSLSLSSCQSHIIGSTTERQHNLWIISGKILNQTDTYTLTHSCTHEVHMHAHTWATDEKCLFLKQASNVLFRGLLQICKDVTSAWFSKHNYLNIEQLTTLKAPESLKLLLTIRKKLVPFRKIKYGHFFFLHYLELYVGPFVRPYC